jgi:NADH-quinone oxidoreductase subunit F
VIEGRDPLLRVLRPYEHGPFATAPQLGWESHEEPGHTHPHWSNPALVNNVESLAHAAWIMADGADAFRSTGTDRSPGTTGFTLSGDVANPGVYERPLGTPVATLIDECGGTASGRPVKVVMSGVANPVLTAAQLQTPADFDSLRAVGAGVGSGGFVYDDEVCALAVAHEYSRFLFVESCGQCPPCKLQSGADHRRARGPQPARARRATGDDPSFARNRRGRQPLLPRDPGATRRLEPAAGVPGRRRRARGRHLSVAARHRRASHPRPHRRRFVLDLDYWRKQPDWSYAPA